MKRLYIETYGCQMNVADSEVVASVMKMAGYEVCDNEADADAVFLNTCSVRENAENRIYHRLEQLHAEQKKGRKPITLPTLSAAPMPISICPISLHNVRRGTTP